MAESAVRRVKEGTAIAPVQSGLSNILGRCSYYIGDMLAADYEDLQESEATDVYVKRFQKQEHLRERTPRISLRE